MLVTAVVLAYHDEPLLEECVEALLASQGVEVEVVVVDNGSDAARIERVDAMSGARVVRPGRNLGFAAGCNAGAAVAMGDVLVLVNQDAVVDRSALSALAATACRSGVGVATGCVRLLDDPETVNSAGNAVHYLAFSWAGGFGDRATRHDEERPVAAASGTALAIRRALWEQLGGFAPEFFAYYEDTELSMRCWHRGLSVLYVPDAVGHHRYEFGRNAQKFELIERNRLVFLLTLFEARTLLLLLPALLLAELGIVALALKDRWGRQKVAGWVWLVRNRRWLRQRRAELHRERVRGDGDLAWLFTARLDPGNVGLPAGAGLLNLCLAGYWRLVRGLLRHSAGHAS